MRYDEKTKKVNISVREAVAIARRGISETPIFDEDEPELLSDELGYAKSGELSLSREFSIDGIDFLLSGRVIFAERDEIHCAFPIARIKDAKRGEVKKQARAEGFILGAMYLNGLSDADEIRIKTVYVSATERETLEVEEAVSRAKAEAFFEKCVNELSTSGHASVERVTKRLPSMRAVRFPYGKPRAGQDEFIRAAYRTIAKGGELYATAPTGTGKTVSALFPAVRALGAGKCDKVFYLTPKTTTAKAAEECITSMREGGALIRSITLVAKEKVCTGGSVCKIAKRLCPANRDNRMKEAVVALSALDLSVVTPEVVKEVAVRERVCPYELSLTYAELCDVVICDFNYLFDPDVYIRRFFSTRGDYAFLIDEAHNLAERAREMYSAEISLDDFRSAEVLGEHSTLASASATVADIFAAILLPLVKDELREDKDGILHGAYHTHSMPADFYEVFEKLSGIAEEELFSNYGAKDDEKSERIAFIREYAFKIRKFARAVRNFDESFELFVFQDGDELRAKVFCLDTGSVIRERLELGRASVIFSGTLSPLSYYKAVLGGDGASATLTVDSPFVREQLSVSIMDKITTRFSERKDSLPAICKVIAATLSAKRGNYMIFSPSFAYSRALSEAFSKKYPRIRVISQTPGMSAEEKAEFLEEFSKNDGSYLAAFCVMGGIYSEGIDLAGDKLIGAVIVGIGMPQLSFEREAIRAYYDEKLEAGTEYAYLYPGMNRVLQAAGRVIRTEDDFGVIVLIDDRFDDPIYKKTAPALWSGMQFLETPYELRDRLDGFWQEVDEGKEHKVIVKSEK